MEELKPIRLRAEDLKTLRWIGLSGCATGHQLDVVVYSRGLKLRQAQRKIRLKRLTDHDFVSRLRLSKEGWGGSSQFVYFLLDKGIWELKQHDMALALEPLPPRITDYVLHQLQVNEVRIGLYKSAPERLLNWCSDRYLMQERERMDMPLPVVPDAYFILATERGERHFFLEVERRGEIEHWQDKVERFVKYRYVGYPEVFGTDDLTILTVAQDAKHLRNLKEAAASPLFWFALLEDVMFRFEMVEVASEREDTVNETYVEYQLKPSRILQRVWSKPYDSRLFGLLNGEPNLGPSS